MKNKKAYKENIRRFAGQFNPGSFMEKIKSQGRSIGAQSVYALFLLYFAFQEKDTPLWAKNVVVGVLGYFISPIDGIPDLTPFVGYTDDIGLLGFGLVTIAAYVHKGIRAKAQDKVSRMFGSELAHEFAAVDKKL